MVDPNRKINRLTDKDIEFLDECEEEFGNRYTEEDEDFMQHCSKSAEPPIVENWGSSGGQYNNRGGNRGSGYRSAYNNRGWNRRGGGDGDRNYRGNRNNRRGNRPHPYDNRDRNDNRRRFNDDRREDDDNRPPMNVRRDYGNFVAASKD